MLRKTLASYCFPYIGIIDEKSIIPLGGACVLYD